MKTENFRNFKTTNKDFPGKKTKKKGRKKLKELKNQKMKKKTAKRSKRRNRGVPMRIGASTALLVFTVYYFGTSEDWRTEEKDRRLRSGNNGKNKKNRIHKSN